MTSTSNWPPSSWRTRPGTQERLLAKTRRACPRALRPVRTTNSGKSTAGSKACAHSAYLPRSFCRSAAWTRKACPSQSCGGLWGLGGLQRTSCLLPLNLMCRNSRKTAITPLRRSHSMAGSSCGTNGRQVSASVHSGRYAAAADLGLRSLSLIDGPLGLLAKLVGVSRCRRVDCCYLLLVAGHTSGFTSRLALALEPAQVSARPISWDVWKRCTHSLSLSCGPSSALLSRSGSPRRVSDVNSALAIAALGCEFGGVDQHAVVSRRF